MKILTAAAGNRMVSLRRTRSAEAARPMLVSAMSNIGADKQRDRYRTMASEYQKLCQTNPARKVGNALHVGASAFGLTKDQVVGDSRNAEIVEKRHKIIAFAVAVTDAPLSHIERAFNRARPAVKAAVERYAEDIKAAIFGE